MPADFWGNRGPYSCDFVLLRAFMCLKSVTKLVIFNNSTKINKEKNIHLQEKPITLLKIGELLGMAWIGDAYFKGSLLNLKPCLNYAKPFTFFYAY
jgi:hypothetical protein